MSKASKRMDALEARVERLEQGLEVAAEAFNDLAAKMSPILAVFDGYLMAKVKAAQEKLPVQEGGGKQEKEPPEPGS